MSKKDINQAVDPLLAELRGMIADAREQVAQVANAALTTLYWQIGQRISRNILGEERADYGEQIVASLGRQLTAEFGAGFGEKNLRRMMQFVETFPNEEIVAALRRQLGWSHFKALIPIQDSLKLDCDTKICGIERWSSAPWQNCMTNLCFG